MLKLLPPPPGTGKAEPMEPVYRDPTLRDVLVCLRDFMVKKPTGLPVVFLPLLIAGLKLILVFRGGAQAVEVAQSELWILWAWCVFRVFV